MSLGRYIIPVHSLCTFKFTGRGCWYARDEGTGKWGYSIRPYGRGTKSSRYEDTSPERLRRDSIIKDPSTTRAIRGQANEGRNRGDTQKSRESTTRLEGDETKWLV